MKGVTFGDEIVGEKIILEAGHIDLETRIHLAKSHHHGDRATRRKMPGLSLIRSLCLFILNH